MNTRTYTEESPPIDSRLHLQSLKNHFEHSSSTTTTIKRIFIGKPHGGRYVLLRHHIQCILTTWKMRITDHFYSFPLATSFSFLSPSPRETTSTISINLLFIFCSRWSLSLLLYTKTSSKWGTYSSLSSVLFTPPPFPFTIKKVSSIHDLLPRSASVVSQSLSSLISLSVHLFPSISSPPGMVWLFARCLCSHFHLSLFPPLPLIPFTPLNTRLHQLHQSSFPYSSPSQMTHCFISSFKGISGDDKGRNL